MSSVWILTVSVNDYRQHGDYFCGLFWSRPRKMDFKDNNQYDVPDRVVDRFLEKLIEESATCVYVQDGDYYYALEEIVK